MKTWSYNVGLSNDKYIFSKKMEYVLSKRDIKSRNINWDNIEEWNQAQTESDLIDKLSIAQKGAFGND